jgi:hypothetical protein
MICTFLIIPVITNILHRFLDFAHYNCLFLLILEVVPYMDKPMEIFKTVAQFSALGLFYFPNGA